MRNKVAAVLLWLFCAAIPVRAGVIVLANRTSGDVTFTAAGKAEQKIAPYEQAVLYVDGGIAVSFGTKQETRTYRLDPDSAYFFDESPAGIAIYGIGALGSRDKPAAALPDKPEGVLLQPPPLATIPVRILVDEEEPASRVAWETRLRKRVAAASAVTERACRVRFEVAAADTWESDNKAPDLPALLTDFEKKAPRGKARLQIGFTSQRTPDSTTALHLGGTRLPLHPYILVREWTPRSEPGRLEVLLHELGHYLGAVHSPETTSVMRPKLGDGRSVSLRFPVDYDPLNILAMNLIASELRTRHIRSLVQLSEPTKDRLRQIYREVQTVIPDDPSTGKFLALLGAPPKPEAPQVEAPRVELPPAQEPVRDSELEKNARVVIATVVKAAQANRRLPDRATPGTAPPFRRSGDALTDYYVREAAAAARDLPQGEAAPAFLVGLAIALDTSDLFRKNPVTGGLWRRIESDENRERRLEVLGLPTMYARHDSCQHFVDSAALVVVIGPPLAETAGVVKELLDAQTGGSGFSFADLASDLSGVAFGREILAEPGFLHQLAKNFTVVDFALPPDGLVEGLTYEQFSSRFGSVADKRFTAEQEKLRKRVRDLAGYNPVPPGPVPEKRTPAPPPKNTPAKVVADNVAPKNPAPVEAISKKTDSEKQPEAKPAERPASAPSTAVNPSPAVESPPRAPPPLAPRVPLAPLAFAGLGVVALLGALHAIWPRRAASGQGQTVRTPVFSSLVLALAGFSLLGVAYARWSHPASEPETATNVAVSDLDPPRAEAPLDPFAIPTLRLIRIPGFSEARAVWGATGLDSRGHIWLGVSAGGEVEPSARLMEFEPQSETVTARGDVLEALHNSGLLRPGDGQGTIRTRIVQAADGYLYFASTNEETASAAGSHLWRTRPADGRWEHLLAAPERLFAAACGGPYIYALGLPDHVLYQYQPATASARSVRVGSVEGLFSNHVLADHRGHAYVPRLRQAPTGIAATLVELNANLEEVAETPLDAAGQASRGELHGLVAVQPLADHSLAFVTDRGILYRVVPGEAERPATVSALGPIHPRGDANVVALFSPDGEQFLMGLARRQTGRYEWLVYDLRIGRSVVVPVTLPVAENGPLKNLFVYGSMTRDDQGCFYLAGTYNKAGIDSPVLIQVRPGH